MITKILIGEVCARQAVALPCAAPKLWSEQFEGVSLYLLARRRFRPPTARRGSVPWYRGYTAASSRPRDPPAINFIIRLIIPRSAVKLPTELRIELSFRTNGSVRSLFRLLKVNKAPYKVLFIINMYMLPMHA